MKILIFTALLLSFPIVGHAEDDADSNKAMILQNIDQRIASLQAMKSCMQSASGADAMKACREKHRGEMDALHDSGIDKRIQKLQEKKAKRGDK